MNSYQEETYGERIAAIYDEWYCEFDETTLDVLADLVNGGWILELGIGTGRVTLPLQQRSVEVHGIDASEAMVARLRANLATAETFSAVNGLGDLSFGANAIWVANGDHHSVTKLDLDETLQATYEIGSGPHDVFFEVLDIWTSNSADNTVTKISLPPP